MLSKRARLFLLAIMVIAIPLAACSTGGGSGRMDYNYPKNGSWQNSNMQTQPANSTPRSLDTSQAQGAPLGPVQSMPVGHNGNNQQTQWSSAQAQQNNATSPNVYSESVLNAPQANNSYVNNGQEQQSTAYVGYNQAPLAPQAPMYNAAPQGSIVKIGLLLPLSGKHADLGQSMLQAAQLALFDMNYTNIEIIPRDTQGTTSGARQAAKEALESGASLLLGPIFSHAVKGAKPIAEQYGVPLLGFSTDWRVAGGNTFVMGVLPFAQAERMAEFAAQNNWRRIGIIAPKSDYGDAVVEAFKQKALSIGLTITEEVRFTEGSNNITPEVREFAHYDESQAKQASTAGAQNKQAPYDAIFVPVGGDQAKSLINLLSYYDLGTDKVAYLGTGLWDETSFHSEPAAQKAYYAAPAPAARSAFESKYQNVYGTIPPRLVSIAYDATALAAVLADQGLTRYGRPDYTPQALLNPNGFAGVDGIFRFHRNGRIERALAVHQVTGMTSRVISPAATTFQGATY